MNVQVIPLSEHHPVYCAEDIEIWEVSRNVNRNVGSSSNRCVFSTWGETKTLIPVSIDGINISIHQSPAQAIGGVLWPSSAVASRYSLCFGIYWYSR